MITEQAQANSPESGRVTTAFLLGWSVAEVLGHLRKGTRPPSQVPERPADYAPRLVASRGRVDTSMDAFILAAQRVAQFYRDLGFEPDDKASLETKEIYALPRKVEEWLNGESPDFVKPKDLRALLNSWSMSVWARLDAVAPESARAFTVGMSIADTYWYLRPPRQRPQKAKAHISQEDWHRLLSKSRMDAERSRLASLGDHLPRYTAEVMRRHLSAWGIGERVMYRNEKWVLAEEGKHAALLEPRDEVKLQQALERQTQYWDAMLFGLREATTFLHSRERRLIMLGRIGGLFVALFITALLLIVLGGVAGFYIGNNLLPAMVQFLNERQAKFSEWLTVVNLLWTALFAVPVPFVIRQLFQATRNVQLWLDEYLTVYFIAQRTYVPWNRYLSKEQLETTTNGD